MLGINTNVNSLVAQQNLNGSQSAHLAMLRRLREHDQIDWERASLDGASVSSPRGARKPAPTRPTAASSDRSDTSS